MLRWVSEGIEKRLAEICLRLGEGPRLCRMYAGRGFNLHPAFDFLDQNQR